MVFSVWNTFYFPIERDGQEETSARSGTDRCLLFKHKYNE